MPANVEAMTTTRAATTRCARGDMRIDGSKRALARLSAVDAPLGGWRFTVGFFRPLRGLGMWGDDRPRPEDRVYRSRAADGGARRPSAGRATGIAITVNCQPSTICRHAGLPLAIFP